MKTKLKIVITLVVVFIASKPFSGCIKESQLANIHDISPSDAQELITAANVQFERHIEGLIPVQQILQHNSRSKHATINFYFKYNDKAEVSLAAIREQEMIDLARFTPVKLQVSEMEGVLLFQKKFASKSIAFCFNLPEIVSFAQSSSVLNIKYQLGFINGRSTIVFSTTDEDNDIVYKENSYLIN